MTTCASTPAMNEKHSAHLLPHTMGNKDFWQDAMQKAMSSDANHLYFNRRRKAADLRGGRYVKASKAAE